MKHCKPGSRCSACHGIDGDIEVISVEDTMTWLNTCNEVFDGYTPAVYFNLCGEQAFIAKIKGSIMNAIRLDKAIKNLESGKGIEREVFRICEDCNKALTDKDTWYHIKEDDEDYYLCDGCFWN